ncbi:MAG: cation-translocating P-type ATPase [Anaerolineales bacterium]|nr:cation-translocating P-type ATPase [Anaerolineales bacterium]
MKNQWFKLTPAQVLQELGTDAEQGLPVSEARRRVEDYGPNELIEEGGRTRLQIIWEQLSGILTILLFIAALVSAALGDWIETVVILIIVVLNAILGYTQEYRAEQSMAALKRMSVPTVRVRRGGEVLEVSASDLVPGDVVLLETGNIVPADGRALVSANLRADEAALTGESEPVEKDAELVFETDRALGDRRNMLYSGTIVSYGRGEFVVTETGMSTELGHIARMIQSVDAEKTPLQERLDSLGKVLAIAALALVAVVFVLGWLGGETDIEELLLTSVSLAVAAVPEAMTAVVTIALSLGAQRMLRRNALIRKLPAVETLGSVDIICSDKTGTLTVNQMTVTAVDIANHAFELVQHPEEDSLELVPADGQPLTRGTRPSLDLLLIAAALCNDAVIVPDDQEGHSYHAVGDATEGALVLAAAQIGVLRPDLEKVFPRIAELPFDSERKRMTTLNRTPQDEADLPPSLVPVWERRLPAGGPPPPYIGFTKGAIDGLLEISDRVWVEGEIEMLDDTWRERIMASHDQMAAQGKRVLAVALRGWDEAPPDGRLEENLILLGLFGMMDPPRPEVREAVRISREAGIRPVMITGDHPLTARHIAQQVGITEDDEFLTGQELERLSQSELVRAAKETSVFARVSPEHKLRLIDVYQSEGGIVSMTGDGVNDAPALKKADIGVAMGITGTDVAKGAADMVLLDDNFSTIVAAVEEGRIIFDNIRHFIKYLLTCNTSEVAAMILGSLAGLPLPLLPLQILWMNLVTDGLPALALGVEPGGKDVMKRAPETATRSVFGHGMVSFILVIGVIMSVLALVPSWLMYQQANPNWQTVLFTTLVFSQLAVALEARSESESIFRVGFFTNRSMVWALVVTIALQLVVIYLPLAQGIFKTNALTAPELGLTVVLSLVVIVVIEIQKLFSRRRKARG